ncbi:hypothetical protein HPP92_006235 [Vanilla planifolia]|uniref:Uncharacterized protein n=1 Tax=Vanilla planifolia TaxID=51239 RepID=A0A835RV69_VANPL|nr:hypothetical protein HPP92_006235 [Vanilla planifolia]
MGRRVLRRVLGTCGVLVSSGALGTSHMSSCFRRVCDFGVLLEGKTNLSHDGLNPAHIPYWWVNNPTIGEFYFTMIERADIEGSKSNIAMDAWLPQASYPCGCSRFIPSRHASSALVYKRLRKSEMVDGLFTLETDAVMSMTGMESTFDHPVFKVLQGCNRHMRCSSNHLALPPTEQFLRPIGC